jgi:hypothetical protein
MARIKYVRGDEPNSGSILDQVTLPSYSLRRGKIVKPITQTPWNSQRDSNGRTHDASSVERANQLLDESLRD